MICGHKMSGLTKWSTTNSMNKTSALHAFETRQNNLNVQWRFEKTRDIWKCSQIVVSALILKITRDSAENLLVTACALIELRAHFSDLQCKVPLFTYVRSPAYVLWLAPWAGKMNQIARCDSLPGTARRAPREKFPRKPNNKSFIVQAFSVTIAAYWHKCSVFAFLWTRSINTQNQNLANIQPSWLHA